MVKNIKNNECEEINKTKIFSFTHFADLHIDGVSLNDGIEKDKKGFTIIENIILGKLDEMVDNAISNNHKLIVFSGDIADTPRLSHNIRSELTRVFKRIVNSGIKLVLVAGNHDTYMGENLQHSLSGLEFIDNDINSGNIIISDPYSKKIEIKTIEISTENGVMNYDLLLIPYIYSNPEKNELGLNEWVKNKVSELIESAKNPIIAVYHGTISGAMLSSERKMPDSINMTLEKEVFDNPKVIGCFAGHIHKKQEFPKIEYAGAFVALTQADEDEKFGYNEVTIFDDNSYEVSHIDTNIVGFKTIEIGIPEDEPVMAYIENRINQEEGIENKIVRLKISATEKQRSNIDKTQLIEIVNSKKPFYFNPIRTSSQLDITKVNDSKSIIKITHSDFTVQSPISLAKAKLIGEGNDEKEVDDILSLISGIENEILANN